MNAKNEGGPGMMPAAPIEDPNARPAAALEVYTPSTLAEAATPLPSAGATMYAAKVEAEVKARALIAQARPRKFLVVRQRLLEACSRPRFAEAALYSVPRGGKNIVDLSIRFAEEFARHHGNLDIGSNIINESDERRSVLCFAVDLETNVPWSREIVVEKTVERKVMQKGDEFVRQRLNARQETIYIVRATADQILMSQNATTSKTLRTLILNHCSADLKDEARETIDGVLAGEITKDPVTFRKRLVDSFRNLNVTLQELEEFLGHAVDQATEPELKDLNRKGKAIDAGETTWREIMREQREAGDAPTSTAPAGEEKPATGKPAGAMDALRQKTQKPDGGAQ